MSVLHLDLRDRPPPEPMERILQALPILPDGWRLVALTPMRPLPLLPMLEADGYAWRVLDLEQGDREPRGPDGRLGRRGGGGTAPPRAKLRGPRCRPPRKGTPEAPAARRPGS